MKIDKLHILTQAFNSAGWCIVDNKFDNYVELPIWNVHNSIYIGHKEDLLENYSIEEDDMEQIKIADLLKYKDYHMNIAMEDLSKTFKRLDEVNQLIEIDVVEEGRVYNVMFVNGQDVSIQLNLYELLSLIGRPIYITNKELKYLCAEQITGEDF